ncbi:nucleolar protein 56 [Microdochium nivale]|nr:nucleolar protein 56 [Microdochium nivale]
MADISMSRSPKRKRADLMHEPHSLPHDAQYLHTTTFSFEPPSSSQNDGNSDDGSSSPRSKVAHTLKHLALSDGPRGTSSPSGVTPAHQNTELGGDTSSPSYTTIDSAAQSHEATTSSPQKPRPEADSEPDYATTPAVFMFDGSSRMMSDHDMVTDVDDHAAARKRLKLPDATSRTKLDIRPRVEGGAGTAEPFKQDKPGHIGLEFTIDEAVIKPPSSAGIGSLKKSYPSINRLSDSKSRSRKKLPASPLAQAKQPSSLDTKPIKEETQTVVDPVRAALTWQEDEITIYDPEDKDDDGTGINGIGFKPSAAVAHQRAQKRRQQLAEYRKREEGEARARRNQRRREQLGAPPPLERKHSVIRVRFSEAEPSTVIMT